MSTSPTGTGTAASGDTAMSARELFEEVLSRMSTGRFEEAAELYAQDFELSLMFHLPDPLVVRGHADHRKKPTGMWDADGKPRVPRTYDDIEIRDLVIHQTTDPNIIVAEWAYVSRIGDSTVVNPNIVVLEARDGKIVRSRDYHNHVARARSDGNLPQQIAVIEDMVLPEDR